MVNLGSSETLRSMIVYIVYDWLPVYIMYDWLPVYIVYDWLLVYIVYFLVVLSFAFIVLLSFQSSELDRVSSECQ